MSERSDENCPDCYPYQNQGIGILCAKHKPSPAPSDEKLTPGGMIMKLANERANPEPSARECKVRITCDGVAEFVEFVRNTDVTDGELIHLIEYSAFERLQAEWQKEHTAKADAKFDRDRLQAALEAACGEIEKARAELLAEQRECTFQDATRERYLKERDQARADLAEAKLRIGREDLLRDIVRAAREREGKLLSAHEKLTQTLIAVDKAQGIIAAASAREAKLVSALKEREAELIAQLKEHQDDFGTNNQAYSLLQGDLDGTKWALLTIEENKSDE